MEEDDDNNNNDNNVVSMPIFITFQSIFRISVIRNKVFGMMKELPHGCNRVDDNNNNNHNGQYIKGKELLRLSPMTWLAKYGLSWDYVKHYLPIKTLDNIDLECRSAMINAYICHKNATIDTLKQLLQWSPDFAFNDYVWQEQLLRGNEAITKFLVQNYPDQVKFDHVQAIQACASGSVPLVCWLHESMHLNDEWFSLDCACTGSSTSTSCSTTSLEMVKWLHFNIKRAICTVRAIDAAAYHGMYDVVSFLLENRTEGYSTRYRWCSCKWSYEYYKGKDLSKKNLWSQKGLDMAASNNHLDILRYLVVNNSSVDCTTVAFHNASKNGHLCMVEWLHENQSHVCCEPKKSIDQVARNGHLNMIKYFYEKLNCTGGQPLLSASVGGHLHIVSYLLENSKTNENNLKMDAIAANGHLHILHYLLENGIKLYALNTIVHAIRGGPHLDVIRFIVSNHLQWICRLEEVKEKNRANHAFCLAIMSGHLGMVEFIHSIIQSTELLSLTEPLDIACGSGHFEIVKYLHSKGFKCTTNAMDNAASIGATDIVKFLHENRSEGCTMKALGSVTLGRCWDIEIVKFLHSNRSEGCLPDAMDRSLQLGFLHIAHFLYNNRHQVNLQVHK
ncbi:hypothetical protein DFA_07133 [Cavenderia fasciculata]|uniref:Ankyrin repeat-containing protein n=1 Tax=Cavenderia fasciculata TaxID=261658 RepID=F4PVK3_CACFS|nr:uncharacterized protein DFA_07133 [Cavenderia fasciculata]EGG20017.1 hypothetical protein DFA_07133 [Cavenderia fasciculata]|eukprot:XP_004367000.1 hypothetical protein DFA_07133 [Cavenderia fasciculata]